MNNKTYKSMANQISPEQGLIENTAALMKTELRKSSKFPRKFFCKPVLAAVVLCICLLFSVPVLAANIPSFNKLLYIVTPEIAQFLQPIQMSSESNNIRMEVVAAMNDEDTAVVYLTLQDLAGNRIDKTAALYDYSIKGYTSFTHELTHYDNKTNTATIRLVANGGEKMNGKKITVSVNSFLSNKRSYENIPLNIDLSSKLTRETLSLNMGNIPGGGGNGFEELKRKGTIQVIKPKDTGDKINDQIDFVSISEVGFIDDKLHIQTDWTKSVDNHGFIVLKDAQGKEVSPTNVYFGIGNENKTTYGSRYVEYIFDITQNKISDYKAYGTFIQNRSYTEGIWNVTFKIKAINSTSIIKKDLDIGKMRINELKITPLGISMDGKNTDTNIETLNMEVISNGESIPYNHFISSNGKVKWIPTSPIQMDKIEKIKINDTIIPLVD